MPAIYQPRRLNKTAVWLRSQVKELRARTRQMRHDVHQLRDQTSAIKASEPMAEEAPGVQGEGVPPRRPLEGVVMRLRRITQASQRSTLVFICNETAQRLTRRR